MDSQQKYRWLHVDPTAPVSWPRFIDRVTCRPTTTPGIRARVWRYSSALISQVSGCISSFHHFPLIVRRSESPFSSIDPMVHESGNSLSPNACPLSESDRMLISTESGVDPSLPRSLEPPIGGIRSVGPHLGSRFLSAFGD